MDTKSQQITRRVPIFGILSICAPFIGALLFYVTVWILAASLEIPFAFAFGLLLIPITPLCGVGFAITAWIRGERYRVLPWLGLLINLALISWVIANRNNMFGSMGC
jgi:hypothetical protein